MSALVSQAVDTIIANTIAVVEGTGSYTGVPGAYSHDEALALTVTADSGSTTTIVDAASSYAADRWVKARAPSFFALCTSATNAANVNKARKISAWAQATKTFTVGAFPAAVSAGDTFSVLEGFRGVVDGADEDAELDRRFTVRVDPGEPLSYYGTGSRTLKADLVLTLSLALAGKHDSGRRSAMTNAEILRSAVAMPAHWEATYTRAIMTDGSKVEIDTDDGRSVVTITWAMLYRIALGF